MTNTKIDSEVAQFKAMNNPHQSFEAWEKWLREAFERIATASKEEGRKEVISGRVMYQTGYAEGFAAAIEMVREKLPTEVPAVKRNPSDAPHAIYTAGRGDGKNEMLATVLSVLNTLPASKE